MLAAGLTVLLIVGPIVVAVVVSWIAVRRIRHEPRRWSNAYWLLVAVLLVVEVLAGLGAPGASVLALAVGLVVLTAPLLVLALAVFLIMNGVTMARRESRSLANLLSLLTGLALAALIVIVIPVLLTGIWWLILALTVVLLLAAYAGFQFVAFAGYALLYPRLVRNRPADWIVVLGSGLGEGGRVPPLLAARLRTGLEEFRRRRARTLIVSGGKGSDEARSEAEAMAEWTIANGADPRTVQLESRSRNTEENLRFSRELVPLAEGLIVTSNYHVLRAAILARKLGIPAQAAGAPTAGYYWPSAMIREFIAILAERPVLHSVIAACVALPVPLLVAGARLFMW